MFKEAINQIQHIYKNQSPKNIIKNRNSPKRKNGINKKKEGKLTINNDEQFEDLNIDTQR